MVDEHVAKAEIVKALTERAKGLWGAERAREARENIEEAAKYVWLIAEHPPDDEEAPLFHP